ncbi:TonB-dependent receptor [Jhaorihella thermophila]
MADYLASLPGLTVSANGGIGANTQVRIRGLDGKYIKVMVNGIDVTDPSQPQTQFNWAGMTTSSVSRIEVLKGSASSLYGSRAIGGVINITTAPQGDEPGTRATVAAEAGSEKTRRAEAAVTHRTERGGLSLAVNRVETDGFSASAAGTEPDGYKGTQLTLSGDVQATDVLRLGFSTYYLDAEGDFDEFGGDGAPPYDENNTTDTRAARAWAQLQTGAVTHELSYTYYKNDRVSSSNGFDSVFNGKRKKSWTMSAPGPGPRR